jgi:cellulose synthase operon protein C
MDADAAGTGPKLVAIYVSLAKDLQQQMEIAEPAVKRSLGVGFESFLEEVAADATELNILNWVAETYRGMGESYGSTLKTLSPEAKNYFTKAANTYEKILARGGQDPDFMSEGMTIHVRIQLAKSRKSMGDYIAARNIYEEVLKAKPILLPVQIEAARLYQDWGGTGQGQEHNYLKAIVGDRPNPAKQNKHTIWGWGEIARMTANNPQFRDQFYEARYNLALCRYNLSLAQSDAAKKTDVMKMAKRDIAVTIGFYPDLGSKWRPLFDNLLKNVQQALGERPEGLLALEAQPTAQASK